MRVRVDPAHKVIGGGVLGGKFYEFNPPGNAWSSEEIQVPSAVK